MMNECIGRHSILRGLMEFALLVLATVFAWPLAHAVEPNESGSASAERVAFKPFVAQVVGL
uniref:hypothetical protein n=1 Tax=Paraburkholderia bannensis TaxID=765414 RepID=UPI002ABE2431